SLVLMDVGEAVPVLAVIAVPDGNGRRGRDGRAATSRGAEVLLLVRGVVTLGVFCLWLFPCAVGAGRPEHRWRRAPVFVGAFGALGDIADAEHGRELAAEPVGGVQREADLRPLGGLLQGPELRSREQDRAVVRDREDDRLAGVLPDLVEDLRQGVVGMDLDALGWVPVTIRHSAPGNV